MRLQIFERTPARQDRWGWGVGMWGLPRLWLAIAAGPKRGQQEESLPRGARPPVPAPSRSRRIYSPRARSGPPVSGRARPRAGPGCPGRARVAAGARDRGPTASDVSVRVILGPSEPSPSHTWTVSSPRTMPPRPGNAATAGAK